MASPHTTETRYDVPEEVARLQTTVDEFILLVTSHDALGEDFDLIKTNSKEIKTTFVSEIFGQNWSTNVPSKQVIDHGRDAYEGSRPEISGVSDQVVSTSSDTVAKKSDSRIDIGAKGNVAKDESPSTRLNPEYLSMEKLYPPNEIIEVMNCLDNRRILNTSQNIASSMKSFKKENAMDKITDNEGFKATSSFLVDGVDALFEEIPPSKLCKEKPKNGSPLKLESVEIKQKCKKFQNMNFLMPYYNKFYCNACKVSYSEAGSHDSNQTCNVCKGIFECKMKLADHYLTHEEFHETYCRICHSEIDKHKTVNGRRECCECGYRTGRKSFLHLHLYIHSPLRLFKCEYCGMRFKQIPVLRIHFKNLHPLCELCGKRFVNNNSLDKHRLEEHS